MHKSYYKSCANYSLTPFGIFCENLISNYFEIHKELIKNNYFIIKISDFWYIEDYQNTELDPSKIILDFPNVLNQSLKKIQKYNYDSIILTAKHAMSINNNKLYDFEEKGWNNRRIQGYFLVFNNKSEYTNFIQKYKN